MEIKQSFIYKGTRILFDNKASEKRRFLNNCIDYLTIKGFKEMFIPIIQFQEIFRDKVGDNKNLMFNFTDRGNRAVCLSPEYTAICQLLADSTFKNTNNVKLFYIAECFRGEKPQAGRYRQFTQLGVEILNPTEDYTVYLKTIAEEIVSIKTSEFETKLDVTRGLDYYEKGKGFEIEVASLGSQKQVCGGGKYKNGIGFAIGVDRLLLV